MKNIIIIKTFLLFILIITTLSCTDSSIRRLVWSDEFDYEGAPDPGKWAVVDSHFQRNQERQIYVDNREHVWVENGNLIIQAHSKGNGVYTSGRLETYLQDKWTYGRIEVKAKLPQGKGTWGGEKGIDDTIFPAQMAIDYVRVYQMDLEKLGYDMRDYE